MKIGFVIDDHMGRPGGVQEYVRGLVHFVQRQGHEAVIFAGGGGGTGTERVVALGRSLPFRGSGSSSSLPLTWKRGRALRQLLAREACDVLHVMAPYAPTLSGRLLVHSEAAHVLTLLVALEPWWWRQALGILAQAQWRSVRRFQARLAISPIAAATGRALYGGHYEIVPCGVDVQAFRPDVVPLAPWRDHKLNVLYVGRLEARKGVRHLLDAWALVQRQFPKLRLLVGGDGPERAALEAQATALALRDVVFLGYVSRQDLPALFAAADLFCAPATHAESFGIVLIEALAAGLPIVAAANQGYRALLMQHPGNFIVPPGDARALAGALATLLASPQARQMVGTRNARAAGRYDWDVVGAEVLAVYERIVGARRKG